LIARRAGRDSVIVHRVVDEPVAPHGTEPENDRLTIGLLGSVYSPRQIEQLTAMLARASEILAVPTRLAVIGGAHQRMRHAVRDARVEVDFLGHMAEDEGLEVLRGAFALYIGYPFIRRDRMIRRTSFPAKLATYVQAARPLLVHTPWDSSLTPLFAFQPFTIPWVDEDVRHGARLLASAWRDASLRVSQHEAADAVRRAYFGGDNRERLFDKLNALVT
jgi:hypothetical protein